MELHDRKKINQSRFKYVGIILTDDVPLKY